MEQHPIPQQISTYQFRLIGDMTLHQFSQLAGGVVVAIFFYSLPIIGFIKWLLVIFFVFFGFALAFLPLEDRPLDKWIVAFFKAIYAPTQFIWRKKEVVPEFMQEVKKRAAPKQSVAALPDIAQTSLTEYFQSFSVPTLETPSDRQEQLALEKFEALFKTTPLPANIAPDIAQMPVKEEAKPQIRVKPRKLASPPPGPTIYDLSNNFPHPSKIKPVKKTSADAAQNGLTPRLKITPSQKKGRRVKAKTSASLPMPTAPEQPNIIVGMVLDNEGKIVENAIVEIRNKDGTPVRALRSNRLGQFQIVTPLSDGEYEIEVEKEGLNFDIIKLELTGEIIKPIEIRAQ